MSNTNPNVEARLAQLEDQVQELRNVHSVEDESGKEWTAGKLMELGLTRRQALAAIGTLAIYGGSIWGAIQIATDRAAAATDQVGTESVPVDVYADSLSADSVTSADLGPDGATRQYLSKITSPSLGWKNWVRFDHGGTNSEAIYGLVNLLFERNGGSTGVSETNQSFRSVGNNGDWGTAGSTTSISTHIRLKVDDADNSILYLQVDVDEDYARGFAHGLVCVGSGPSVTLLQEDISQ